MLQVTPIKHFFFRYSKYSLYMCLFFWQLSYSKFKTLSYYHFKYWTKFSSYNFHFITKQPLLLNKSFKFFCSLSICSLNLITYNNTNLLVYFKIINIFYFSFFYFFTKTFFYKKLNVYSYLFIIHDNFNKKNFDIFYQYQHSFKWHSLL